ncbi:MAG: cell division protein ZapA [Alkalispirochaeta sp.]
MMRIELLGASFQIQSDESPEYIDQLLEHFRTRVEQIEQSVATGDPLKKSILAALLVTDELFSEREHRNASGAVRIAPEEANEIEKITTRIISDIDASLPASEYPED